MQGKYVLVSGATSGIDKGIALGLGELGASLILGVRDLAYQRQILLRPRGNPVRVQEHGGGGETPVDVRTAHQGGLIE